MPTPTAKDEAREQRYEQCMIVLERANTQIEMALRQIEANRRVLAIRDGRR